MRIEWTINNQSAHFVPGTRVSTVDRRSSVLTIESVDAKHAGLYNCSASNAAGVASYTTELVVKGARKHYLRFRFQPLLDSIALRVVYRFIVRILLS